MANSIDISELSLGDCAELRDRLSDRMEELRVDAANYKFRSIYVGPYAKANIALTSRSDFEGSGYYLTLQVPHSGSVTTYFSVDKYWHPTKLGLRATKTYPLPLEYRDLDADDRNTFKVLHDTALFHYVPDIEQAFSDWILVLRRLGGC